MKRRPRGLSLWHLHLTTNALLLIYDTGGKSTSGSAQNLVTDVVHDAAMSPSTIDAGSPVHRLPPEVLAHIFVLAHVLDPGSIKLAHIYASHVCKSWRDIALDCANLWGTVDGSVHSDFGSIMLDRSKQAPLKIRIDPHNRKFSEIYRKAFAQSHRLRSVTLYTNWHLADNQPDNALDALVGKVPLLEELSVSLSLNTEPFVFPTGFLCGGAPCLRSLTLHFCEVPWALIPPSTSALQLLSVVDTPDVASSEGMRLSVIDFSKYLQNLDSLSSLKLAGRLPRNDPDMAQPPRIELPKLTQLTLYDTTEAMVDFFQLVKLPKDVIIDITNHFPSFLSSVSILLREIHRSLLIKGEGPQGLGTDVSIYRPDDVDDSHTIQIGIHRRSAARLVGGHHLGEISATIDLNDASPDSIAELLEIINAKMGYSAILALEHRELGLSKANWREVFNVFPQLEEITVGGDTADLSEFVLALDDQYNVSTQDPHPPRLPALSKITLLMVDFKLDFRGHGVDSVTIDFLIEVLKRRPKPYRVQQLIIDDCSNFGQSDFARIRNAVPDLQVIWDAYEDTDSEWEDFDADAEEG